MPLDLWAAPRAFIRQVAEHGERMRVRTCRRFIKPDGKMAQRIVRALGRPLTTGEHVVMERCAKCGAAHGNVSVISFSLGYDDREETRAEVLSWPLKHDCPHGMACWHLAWREHEEEVCEVCEAWFRTWVYAPQPLAEADDAP